MLVVREGGIPQSGPDTLQSFKEPIRGCSAKAGQEAVGMFCNEPVRGKGRCRNVPEVGGQYDGGTTPFRCGDDMSVVGIG